VHDTQYAAVSVCANCAAGSTLATITFIFIEASIPPCRCRQRASSLLQLVSFILWKWCIRLPVQSWRDWLKPIGLACRVSSRTFTR